MKKITNITVSLSLLLTTAILSPGIAIAEESTSSPQATQSQDTNTNNANTGTNKVKQTSVEGTDLSAVPFAPDNTTNNN